MNTKAIDDMMSKKYALHYIHNNFGDNMLFLLRDRNYYPEDDYNKAVMEMLRDNKQEAEIISDYAKTNPNSPFIVPGNFLDGCINRMNFILAGIMPNNSQKFAIEESKFYKFSIVCHDIHGDSCKLNQVRMCGWEYYFQMVFGEVHD